MIMESESKFSRILVVLSTVLSCVTLVTFAFALPLLFLDAQKRITLLLDTVAGCREETVELWKQLSSNLPFTDEFVRTKRFSNVAAAPPFGFVPAPFFQQIQQFQFSPLSFTAAPPVTSTKKISTLKNVPTVLKDFKKQSLQQKQQLPNYPSSTRLPADYVKRTKQYGSACCTCRQGSPGAMGKPGQPGVDGKPGVRGPTGRDGKNGRYLEADELIQDACQKCPIAPPGPPGLNGVKGTRGPLGKPGAPGIPGPEGAKGSQGPVGPPGPNGEDGIKGVNGDPGRVIIADKPGPAGPAGPLGPRGRVGLPGQDGLPGEIGVQGPRGVTGERGNVGKPGNPGPLGPPGHPGTKGSCDHCQIYKDTTSTKSPAFSEEQVTTSSLPTPPIKVYGTKTARNRNTIAASAFSRRRFNH